MQPQFKPPIDEAEFERRAAEMTIESTNNVLTARRRQRALATKPFDDEIKFLEKVLKHKGVTL
jgi:hypothetical protein